MKIGHFCLQSLMRFHFVHDLELIQANLDAGHQVHVIHSGKRMRFSDTTWHVDYRDRLPSEMSCFRAGIALLDGEVALHSVDQLALDADEYPEFQQTEWPEFDSHAALDQFRFGAHDCGNAVRSSLISHLRNTEADTKKHAEWIRRALDTSVLVYLAAKAFIQKYKPDRVYAFNGRMATFRGVLRAAQEAGVECVIHERGATLERISLSKNTMPHDIYWRQQEILRHWEEDSTPLTEKREIGEAFYRKTRDKQVFNWHAYTQGQRVDWLPAEVKQAPRVYSIFTSSEFERYAMPQYYRYLLHDSQLQGIQDVVALLKEIHFDGALCIRIHPNSHNEKPNLFGSLQREIQEDFVHVLAADSPADTYALIDASEKVITFGSTVAMEAAFWGKPSVSFATNPYENLGAIYQPTTRADARRLLAEELAPKGYENCVKYGYYYSTFGQRLRHSTVEGLFDLRFKGQRIRESFAFRKLVKPYHKLRAKLRRAA